MALNGLLDENRLDNDAEAGIPLPSDADADYAQLLPKDGYGDMSEQLLNTLETPQVVSEIAKRLASSKVDRSKLERELKLSYYFGGLEVACKESDNGLVIVASGPPEEVTAVLDTFPAADLNHVTVIVPPRWESWIAGMRAVGTSASR